MSAMTICSYVWCVWGAIWLLWALRGKRTQKRESVSSRLSYMLPNLAGFWLMFYFLPHPWLHARLFPPNRWTDPLGIAITAIGLAFSVWARAYLGSNWSGAVTVKVGHELIRTGPYRWVRHPIYTGLIFAMLGTALVRHQVRGLLAVVFVYAGFKIKSRIEEATMSATFGAAYADYSSSTGAIVPRLRW